MLKDFIDRNGLYPNSRKESEKTLGLWVEVQKRNKRTNILSESRIIELEKLSGWVWDHDITSQWMISYNKLKELLNAG